MIGVPAAGLPKTTTLAGRMLSLAAAVATSCSMTVLSVSPFEAISCFSRSGVASTEPLAAWTMTSM
ncbi:hypothetical protein [Nonomuraea sp. NPDC049158]|uniref:hypothetical protein n=1 Tax=Nonomuraea sp. NPDC049158 TaxID=3155649 RepID=UPI0033F6F05C